MPKPNHQTLEERIVEMQEELNELRRIANTRNTIIHCLQARLRRALGLLKQASVTTEELSDLTMAMVDSMSEVEERP
jgi:hypothetical protein